MAPLVRTGGSRHTGLAALPHRNIQESLYQLIWGKDYISDDNTLNVHISKLRKKLEHIGNQAPYIDTIWGIGYKLHR